MELLEVQNSWSKNCWFACWAAAGSLSPAAAPPSPSPDLRSTAWCGSTGGRKKCETSEMGATIRTQGTVAIKLSTQVPRTAATYCERAETVDAFGKGGQDTGQDAETSSAVLADTSLSGNQLMTLSRIAATHTEGLRVSSGFRPTTRSRETQSRTQSKDIPSKRAGRTRVRMRTRLSSSRRCSSSTQPRGSTRRHIASTA